MSLLLTHVVAATLVSVAPMPAATAAPSGPVFDGTAAVCNANYVNIRSRPATSGGTIYGQCQKGHDLCLDGYVYNNAFVYGTDFDNRNITGYIGRKYVTLQGRCIAT